MTETPSPIHYLCQHCRHELKELSNYCPNCGFPLQKNIQVKKLTEKKGILIAAFFSLILGLALILSFTRYFISSGQPQKVAGIAPPAAQADTPQESTIHSPQKIKDQKTAAVNLKVAPEDSFKYSTCQLFIKNHWDFEYPQIQVVVFNENWFCVPLKLCLGGYYWNLKTETNLDEEIAQGNWHDKMPLGFWSIQQTEAAKLNLAVWDRKKPIHWLSLSASNPSLHIEEIKIIKEQSEIVTILLSESIKGNGLFTQENQLIGWSFEQIPGQGFLCNHDPQHLLLPEISTDYFYNLTFADQPLEYFAEALSIRSPSSWQQKMDLFLKGFAADTFIPDNLLPDYLQSANIALAIDNVLSVIVGQKSYQYLYENLTAEVLGKISNFSIIAKTIAALKEGYGFQTAMEHLEKTIENNQSLKLTIITKIRALQEELYIDWIADCIIKKDFITAIIVWDKAKNLFPENQDLYLLGIEASIAENNWHRAENLLSQRTFSADYFERSQELAKRINELKMNEGKIVINFKPNSKSIPVSGIINDKEKLNFIIDTGATYVSIPKHTCEKLGISLGPHLEEITMSTAAGLRKAYLITLKSITLNNWTEYNIQAVVLDIPNNPDIGLIGLSLLDRFMVELNNEKGIIRLTPKAN